MQYRHDQLYRYFLYGSGILLALACGKFEVSPYAVTNTDTPLRSNQVNMDRLAAREPFDDDTITFVFTGDPQRFYEEQEDMVAKANSIPNVDFFILDGDISDFGLLQEYLWVHERMERLNMPWFAVVGNHDLQANGSLIFQQVFGPLDQSFAYKGYKFILHDTNGMDHGEQGTVPDMGWLAAQLADSTPTYAIAVSHVPPMSGDFDPALVTPYTDLLGAEERMLLSLHAHTGSYFDGHPYGGHVRYIVCNAMVDPQFLVIRIHAGEITTQVWNYSE